MRELEPALTNLRGESEAARKKLEEAEAATAALHSEKEKLQAAVALATKEHEQAWAEMTARPQSRDRAGSRAQRSSRPRWSA